MSNSTLKRDVIWTIDQTEYVVRNVPYSISDEEEVLVFDISVKLTALRDLMCEDQIPHIVNFEDVAHIEF